ncbi:CvpA family protein [Thiotrichales bacterium 19S3-7]|nr:CvpA family protein [Thiotrichales bacterium 19S3-7]MCF6801492.1 CvpA family protein [Thiotrichales bacterium 19S3-11]
MSSIIAYFNWLDWVILAIFVLSVASGFSKGFMREIYSLIVWFVAGVLTYLFSDVVSDKAFSWLGDQRLSSLVSSAVILIGVWIIGRILAMVMTNNRNISLTSRIGGVIVSFIKTFIFMTLIINVINLSDDISTTNTWRQSYLVNKMLDATTWFQNNDNLSEKVPYHDNNEGQSKHEAIGESGPNIYQ